MKKIHGLFGMFALFVAAAVITVAGCSNGSTDDDPAPTAVVLARGSHGTAGNGEITGLAAEKYAVKTGGQWFSVNGDGKLVVALTVNAAFTDAVALSGVTAITKDVNDAPWSTAEPTMYICALRLPVQP